MHRWTSLVFGLLFVAAMVGLVLASRTEVPAGSEYTAASASVSASAAAPAASENPVTVDAGPSVYEADSAASSAFATLADGGPIPNLPDDAPKQVRLGIILFQYRGAEGAPGSARDKQAARAKAEAAVELAKKDFDEAVKLGDPGSLADAGNLPRSVLEPLLEYTVFTLDVGAMHPKPLDTPRGYWIVRRIK